MWRVFLLTLATLVAGCEKKNAVKEDPLATFGRLLDSEEHELIGKIRSAANPEEREILIQKLEATPVKIFPFHSRWSVIHDVDAFDGWTGDRFDSSRVSLPRDLQLLEATCYGLSDIENGGLHQFFGNSTGRFAPEMAEWFERAGLPAAASTLKIAMAKFGDEFPRSQETRQRFLDGIEGEEREQWDPFHDLDGPFYDGAHASDGGFDGAADRWLTQVCGITDLRTPPSGKPAN